MKIIVKGNNWLGDVIMSYPVLSALKKKYEDCEIYVVTKSHLADCYAGINGINAFPYATFNEAVKIIKKLKPDSALILPRSLNSALMVYLARVPKRVGYSYDFRKPFLTKSIPCDKNARKIHRVNYFFNLYNLFTGENQYPEQPKFIPSNDALNQADSLLSESKIYSKFIGINPGAAYGNAKQYFEDRFGKVAIELSKRGYDIAVTGGPAEKDVCERIRDYIAKNAHGRNVVSLAGKTPIPVLAGIMKRMSLYITNDTGPMHLADAVGCKVLAIFGSTDPAATGPFRKTNRIIYTDVECSPCLKRTCPYGHYNCFVTIPPEMVITEAVKMLK